MKVAATVVPLFLLAWALFTAAGAPSNEERLSRLRNLGKAFYENPTTQNEAVEQFRQALELAPKSLRERLNYGLALLRAGKTPEGAAILEQVQKEDPSLPHTWFNLGIVAKKAGDTERARAQFERLVKLAPEDPIVHYNLGAMLRAAGDVAGASREFEMAAKLDHTLAAPHFQLFNLYRTSGRADDAKRELAIFQELKKRQEGAAIPEDVEWNAFAEVYDPPAPAATPQRVEPKYVRGASLGTGVGAARLSATTLVVWSSSVVRLQPGPAVISGEPIVTVAPGDFDNDGFRDVCVLTQGGPRLYRNRAGVMTEVKTALPQGAWRDVVWVDYDHDYDLDLLLIGAKPVLLRNAGQAGFEDRTRDFPFVPGEAIAATMLRVVPDTKSFDLVVSYSDRRGVLYRDQLQGRYRAEDIAIPSGATRLTPVDADGDGTLDIAYSAGGAVHLLGKPEPVLRESGPFVFTDFGLQGVLRPVAAVVAVDLDSDGREDVVRTDGKTLTAYTNRTPAAGRSFLRVRLEGVRNMKLADGAEVEVKAGSMYQKRQYSGLPLTFAAPAGATVDTVRITWPNGLIQNEVKQPVGRTHLYKEAQRLSGSCPMIWTWNGSSFEYITDVLGVAPLGAAAGDGTYFPSDHDEYVQIPPGALVEQDGRYEVRVTEELSEVAYLDSVRLIAVDRPSSSALFTSEKFKAPPFLPLELYEVNDRLAPSAARDDQGRDVLDRVLKKDRTYPDEFERTLSGVAGMHHLELDFGSTSKRALLVLHGWVDWADGSTFLGIAQQKRGGLVPPYLQVLDNRGQWVTVIEDMGMPAGKPKTITVDLTGKFLSDSRQIRIVTDLCVYWDEVFLSTDFRSSRATRTEAPLRSATLQFRGFSPNRIHPRRTQPEKFSYDRPIPASLWNPTPGVYTRYGDVRELAASVDDKLVVMGSGDEMRLLFDARGLPAVPEGFTREFLLHVDGWAKDRDPNTAFGQSTEPLPFHSMAQYGERFPDTPDHRDWRQRYLTRPALRLIRPLQ